MMVLNKRMVGHMCSMSFVCDMQHFLDFDLVCDNSPKFECREEIDRLKCDLMSARLGLG
jgi:hypothetical protein